MIPKKPGHHFSPQNKSNPKTHGCLFLTSNEHLKMFVSPPRDVPRDSPGHGVLCRILQDVLVPTIGTNLKTSLLDNHWQCINSFPSQLPSDQSRSRLSAKCLSPTEGCTPCQRLLASALYCPPCSLRSLLKTKTERERAKSTNLNISSLGKAKVITFVIVFKSSKERYGHRTEARLSPRCQQQMQQIVGQADSISCHSVEPNASTLSIKSRTDQECCAQLGLIIGLSVLELPRAPISSTCLVYYLWGTRRKRRGDVILSGGSQAFSECNGPCF